ncbi:MAG: ATP phosphoribosyltransferase regulatory subunit [Clostridiales bacterium]|nr:ATP phosphoribosyltransferase regulatory subunit [Clostridiales bacterium]
MESREEKRGEKDSREKNTEFREQASLRVPQGMRYVLPDKSFRRLENAITGVFEEWGFQEVIVPTLEYWENSGRAGADNAFKLIDQNGEVLMLRSDMTTPIARLAASRFPIEDHPRLYYSANVFCAEKSRAGGLREFRQMGAEMIGDGSPDCDALIIGLAVAALEKAGVRDFEISLGNAGFLRGLLNSLVLPPDGEKTLLQSVIKRDFVQLEILLQQYEVQADVRKLILSLPSLRGGVSVIDKAISLVKNPLSLAALENLRQVFDRLRSRGMADRVCIDLNLVQDFDYYTGVVFEGYCPRLGVPLCHGGRYDNLLRSYGRDLPATGFAIDFDKLLALPQGEKNDSGVLTIALPKGKLGEEAVRLLDRAGFGMEGLEVEARKLFYSNEEAGINYIICRPTDIPAYVEHGAADIGIVGKDTIVESDKDVFELLDLGYGFCRFVVAAPKEKVEELRCAGKDVLSGFNQGRVATKFPRVAEIFFRSKGLQIEVIKLHGNVELAPGCGLADLIVDIVSTGKTLEENNLTAIAEIFSASARLIANRVSYRIKHGRVQEIAEKLGSLI